VYAAVEETEMISPKEETLERDEKMKTFCCTTWLFVVIGMDCICYLYNALLSQGLYFFQMA
jgi:hypothetical protein